MDINLFTAYIFLSLSNGVLLLFGTWFMITRFFGYEVKPGKHRKAIFIAVLILNTLFDFFCTIYSSSKDIFIASFVVYIFNLVYQLIYLKERIVWKKLAIFLVTENLISLMTQLVTYLVCMPSLFSRINSDTVSIYIFTVTNLVILGFIILISLTSSKKRKEPMAFSLVGFLFLANVIIESAMGAIIGDGDKYGENAPVVSLRLTFGIEKADAIIGYSWAVVLLLLLAFVFFFLIKDSELRYLQKKNAQNEYYLESQKAHYEALSESNREVRKVKHDMKNHLYCLNELYENKRYDELGAYLEDMGAAIQHTEESTFIGHDIADAIIAEKKQKASEKNIEFSVEGSMYGAQLTAIDVCTIFSNILDNAIEATENLPKDLRRISLKVGHNKNYLLISEENPVMSAPEIHDNNISTTKKDSSNHGFGISNIKEAAAKYDGDISLSVEEKNGVQVFSIDVMLPYNPVKEVFSN